MPFNILRILNNKRSTDAWASVLLRGLALKVLPMSPTAQVTER